MPQVIMVASLEDYHREQLFVSPQENHASSGHRGGDRAAAFDFIVAIN